MKNLKLEVGKTYLNRKGERVKIVDNTGHAIFPFDGDDGLCYTLDGRYWAFEKESHRDLIAEAEVPPTFRTFKIPENTREISVNETDGRIIIEFVPEFKRGDVCINSLGTVYLFRSPNGSLLHNYLYGVNSRGESFVGDTTLAGRLATPAEAQQLLDALAKDGRWWDIEAIASMIETYLKEREAQQ